MICDHLLFETVRKMAIYRLYMHLKISCLMILSSHFRHEVLKEFEQDEQKQQNSSLMLEELNHLTQENVSIGYVDGSRGTL